MPKGLVVQLGKTQIGKAQIGKAQVDKVRVGMTNPCREAFPLPCHQIDKATCSFGGLLISHLFGPGVTRRNPPVEFELTRPAVVLFGSIPAVISFNVIGSVCIFIIRCFRRLFMKEANHRNG
ncbi:unnamed protein product [Acidithrix sp. C25]|nr:unnamed protein product [Acidithrix sp. C25]